MAEETPFGKVGIINNNVYGYCVLLFCLMFMIRIQRATGMFGPVIMMITPEPTSSLRSADHIDLCIPD